MVKYKNVIDYLDYGTEVIDLYLDGRINENHLRDRLSHVKELIEIGKDPNQLELTLNSEPPIRPLNELEANLDKDPLKQWDDEIISNLKKD